MLNKFVYKNHMITYDPYSKKYHLRYVTNGKIYATFDTEIDAYQSLIMRLENECSMYFNSLAQVAYTMDKHENRKRN